MVLNQFDEKMWVLYIYILFINSFINIIRK
jgi:hypothetical protein